MSGKRHGVVIDAMAFSFLAPAQARAGESVIPETEAVTEIIRAAAKREILPRYRTLAADESWEKRPGSIVTIADDAAEAFLTEALLALAPGSCTVGEEAAHHRPEILERLVGDTPVWLIDAIDGTANFAAGKPKFAVMVAYVLRGETRAGWIHDPLGDITVTAIAGGGAWRDGVRLALRSGPDTTDLSHLRGSLGARPRRDRDLCAHFAWIGNSACVGHEYLDLAAGRLDFAYFRGLKPWDHAAGQLIHAEAGGYGRCLDGAPYRTDRPAPEGGLLLAPTEASWQAIAALLRDALEKSG
jgi:fructose-1,6-bisphosphatase/inositol monophosphatase family enzyme